MYLLVGRGVFFLVSCVLIICSFQWEDNRSWHPNNCLLWEAFPVNMPLCARTGPILAASAQSRHSFGVFTGLREPEVGNTPFSHRCQTHRQFCRFDWDLECFKFDLAGLASPFCWNRALRRQVRHYHFTGHTTCWGLPYYTFNLVLCKWIFVFCRPVSGL